MNPFEEFVKERLARKLATQQDMAEAIGISSPQLSRILQGKRGRTPDVVRNIGKYLGIDEVEIFRIAEIVLSSPKTDLSPVKRAAIHAIETADDEDVDFINRWLNDRQEHKSAKLTLQPRAQK